MSYQKSLLPFFPSVSEELREASCAVSEPCLRIVLAFTVLLLASKVVAQEPPASAREVLATYGIGPAEFSRLVDDRSITAEEEPVLAKILLRFSRLGLENIHRWRKVDADWSQVAAATEQEQGELFALRGRAKLVTEHKLSTELAQQMEFGRYYAVQIALDVPLGNAPLQALVLTRVVPRAWKPGEPLDEPAIADGLLLKLGPPQANDRQPIMFAAGRVGWLPESSPLARAGFDVSLFDAVRESNGQGLLAADREPFYQLLAAVGRAEKPPGSANSPVDLAALLQQPAEHHGEAFTVRGTARRIVKVLIGDVGLRERLGFDHYYEIDLFVPLGEARIRLDAAVPAKEGPTFESTYPVTLVARQLPPGLEAGEDLHAAVAAEAVFFKLWTYESAYMARHGRSQPAPLLVTHEPRLVPEARPDSGLWGSAMTVLLLAMLVVMLGGWWWYERTDRRRGQRAAASQPRRDGASASIRAPYQFISLASSQCSYSRGKAVSCSSSSALSCLMRLPSRRTSSEPKSWCSSSMRDSRSAISASMSGTLR